MNTHEPGALAWRKSSYSDAGNGCVEVAWRKSTYSAGNGDCVEVAWDEAARVYVRDSKDPDGGVLAVDVGQWRALVNLVAER